MFCNAVTMEELTGSTGIGHSSTEFAFRLIEEMKQSSGFERSVVILGLVLLGVGLAASIGVAQAGAIAPLSLVALLLATIGGGVSGQGPRAFL